MSSVHTEPCSILQAAMRDIDEAQVYYDLAVGQEQIDEAAIRLTSAETTVNRIIRDMKRERGLARHEYKCKFEHGSF